MIKYYIRPNYTLILLLIVIVLVQLPMMAKANHPVDIHNSEVVAIGKVVYVENCSDCHGLTLAGPTNPKDFKRVPPRLDARKGHVSHHNDQLHYNQIAQGSLDKQGNPIDGGMPAFKGILNPDAIWATISYIKSHWPKKIYRKQHMLNPGHGPKDQRKGHHHD